MFALLCAIAFATFYTLSKAKKDPSVHKLLTWMASFIIAFIIVLILELGLIMMWIMFGLSTGPV